MLHFVREHIGGFWIEQALSVSDLKGYALLDVRSVMNLLETESM
jgi:hypothetical protein